jgi:hypothetical protein
MLQSQLATSTNYPNSLKEYSLFGDKSYSTSEARVKEFRSTSIKERLWNNSAELKVLTSWYSLHHLNAEFKNQFFSQIDWLLDSEDWDEDDLLANEKSFVTLIKFILNSNPKQAPFLTLTDSGNLVGTWINKENKFRLECFENDSTNWFVSIQENDGYERAMGESRSIKRLIDSVKPYKAGGWFNF